MKRNIFTLIACVTVGCLIPQWLIWCTEDGVWLVPVFYFIIWPGFAVILGMLSGLHLKKMWFFPAIYYVTLMLPDWTQGEFQSEMMSGYSMFIMAICVGGMLFCGLLGWLCTEKESK